MTAPESAISSQPAPATHWLLRLYFLLFDFLVTGPVAKMLGRHYGLRRERALAYQVTIAPIHPGASPLWFHAASVGELEMIMPILERALEHGIACSVSAFSDSALPWLVKLSKHPRASLLRYVGLSPRERDWKQLWSEHQVQQVWIAKYDFWPGMWAAAAALGIRVQIVNARYRSSWAKLQQWMKRFHAPEPEIYFHCSHPEMKEGLAAHFPRALVTTALDPRRIRIRERANRQEATAERVKQKIASLTKPVGIIGSAWPSDLQRLAELTQVAIRGSLVVFPHSFEPKNLDEVREALTSVARAHPIQTLIVEEKGVLLECYALADWVMVGGGFGDGIHSTLEPAYYGVPLLAGPKNAAKFDEIAELVQAKQLTLCAGPDEIARWFKTILPRLDAPHASTPIVFPTRQEFEAWIDPLLAPVLAPPTDPR